MHLLNKGGGIRAYAAKFPSCSLLLVSSSADAADIDISDIRLHQICNQALSDAGMISTMTAFTNICTMSFSLDLSRQVFHQKNLSMSLKNLAQVLISQEPPIVKKFPTCLM